MKLPKNNSLTRKLIDAMPKDRGVSRAHMPALMLGIGYNENALRKTILRLIKVGYLYEAGTTYRLSKEILKNFHGFDADDDTGVIVENTFKPLGIGYIETMRRAQRLDGRQEMIFYPREG